MVMLVEHKREWKQAGRVLLILTSRPKRATQDHNTTSSHAADSWWRPQTDGCGGRRRESCSWWWLCGPAIMAAPHPNCSWCVPPTLRWFEDAQLVFSTEHQSNWKLKKNHHSRSDKMWSCVCPSHFFLLSFFFFLTCPCWYLINV